ncbi:MAG: hypothetical protein DME19_20955 [Verrucomicrobia bacterium]|nr:MAG: hypothetical protein DME19_20955 [Verrucomicrobiota bacterium]
MNLRILKMVSGLAVAIAIQFGPGGQVFGATKNVTTSGFTFVPKSVTINVGDSVTWTGLTIHNVQTDTDPFCGPVPVPNATCTKTFNQAGTYNYYCSPHRSFGMTGTVIVQAVSGTPPSVTVTNPADGSVFAAPADVTLQATASDADGTVANVQFFANANPLGTATTSPFSIVASNLDAGIYALRAVAADNSGLTSTSPVVNVSVVAPVAVALSSPVVSNGRFQFTYSADAGLRYAVENSSNLVDWTSLATNTASGSAELFGETFDVNVLRFYRVERLRNP